MRVPPPAELVVEEENFKPTLTQSLFLGLINRSDLNQLMDLMEEYANEHYDGHFSVLKFTTGYKAFFGTPDRDEMWDVRWSWDTPWHAIVAAFCRELGIPYVIGCTTYYEHLPV